MILDIAPEGDADVQVLSFDRYFHKKADLAGKASQLSGEARFFADQHWKRRTHHTVKSAAVACEGRKLVATPTRVNRRRVRIYANDQSLTAMP